MQHIQTLNGATLKQSAAAGGCGECQSSCQSACKTSCTVANQTCENTRITGERRQPAKKQETPA
jgi:predicted ribosomally synthesized six-cysteine peptide SCIFF